MLQQDLKLHYQSTAMYLWLSGARSDVYSAARVGDLDRVKVAVEEEGVDVNQRDRWDSVPLYYACLAGDEQPHSRSPASLSSCTLPVGIRIHWALTTSIVAIIEAWYDKCRAH